MPDVTCRGNGQENAAHTTADTRRETEVSFPRDIVQAPGRRSHAPRPPIGTVPPPRVTVEPDSHGPPLEVHGHPETVGQTVHWEREGPTVVTDLPIP